MNRNQIIDSLGRIDTELIQSASNARSQRNAKNALRKWISLAACFLLVCSIAITAEATSGSVSNLLAPLFGGTRTEIVNQIGIPTGASASVNGYTLTADAIIGDRYYFAVVYTLSRDDGQPIPDNIRFLKRETRVGGSGSAVLSPIQKDTQDPSIAHFTEQWRRNVPLIGRIITASFSTLAIEQEGADDTVIAEGTWELTYTLRYQDSSETIPLMDFYVTDNDGHEYKVKRIVLSPVGVHLDLVFYDPDATDGIFTSFKTALLLVDGTEISLEGGGGGSWTQGDKRAKVSYYADFSTPIPREEIQAIQICGTSYFLHPAG